MNFKSIVNLFSILILFFSISYVFPIIVSYIYKDGAISLFLSTLSIVSLIGIVGVFLTRGEDNDLSQKDGFVIIVLFWIVLSFAGSVPFYLSGMTFIDSIFESTSGITTTGATVISNIDALPESLLFYRQLLQWMGGMGLIVLAIAVMPLLGIGGGQIYKTEVPGAMGEQRLTPRIKETAQALWLIYLGLTIACAVLYYFNGMSVFDSISHSMSTVAIGGFSTHNESIGFFDSISIELICMVFMLLSSFSFALHYFAIYKSKPLKYFYDPELRFFASILLLIFIIALIINFFSDMSGANIRQIAFHSVSMITTTGFSISDTSSWPFSISFLLLIGAFVGACSGSVGGGVKSWRVLIMINHAYKNIMTIIHPNSVISLKIGTKNVDDQVATSVWGFFSIYIISFVILLLGILISGLDFESAFSAVGACLNNLGPGLGAVSENYSQITSFSKGILAFAMLLGRLEIFTLLVLLTPMFWEK
ncbi:MAG: potassium transporter [Gammaproteobacteria bacterium]|nr:potassium transporter [Gammaproteobacteria bacterium]|tara:strand:- start:16713 stop:18146 length:1434 start_codon:yes stop_codon:yes gene_type:complete